MIRSRVRLADATAWRKAARAPGAAFARIRPACTVVGAARFIEPEWRVAIELDAAART